MAAEQVRHPGPFDGIVAGKMTGEILSDPTGRPIGALGPARRGYAGCRAVLATMHGKEIPIGPALWATARLHVATVGGLDTDELGTFTGEIPRVGTMLEVAIRKARMGMAAARWPVGLASEGSFGPHPVLAFVPAGLELLVLVDDGSGLVIHESLVVEKTNFSHLVVTPGQDLGDYLRRIGFPSHGLVVRPNAGHPTTITAKGIIDRESLEDAVARAQTQSLDGQARLETDMRAHRNPTRMRSLGELADRLGRRLATRCPTCRAPGWGRTDVVTGLPCAWCGQPTDLVAREVFTCAAGPHRDERPRSDGLTAADPGRCATCNP